MARQGNREKLINRSSRLTNNGAVIVLKRIFLYFRQKKKLIESIESQNKLIESQRKLLKVKVDYLVSHMEDLDQRKTYVITLPPDTKDGERERITRLLNEARNNTRWTPPGFIITTVPIKEKKKRR